jgi:integrase
MAVVKITRPSIKALRRTTQAQGPKGPPVFLWDSELPGFGAKCTRNGLVTFVAQYRPGEGGRRVATRRVTIGRLSDALPPEKAREEAARVLATVRLGNDPAEAKRHQRRAPTVADLMERYLAEHAAQHNKPSTAASARWLAEARIIPALGKIKVNSLTRAEVRDWHYSLRKRPIQANRALAVLSKALSLAANDWGMRADNPCRGIRRNRERPRERFLSDGELMALGKALAAAEDDGTPPGVVIAVRLLALTGLRLSEALGLRWDDVDLAGGTLRLRDAKVGPRTIVFGALVAKFLAGLERAGDYVVPGIDPTGPLNVSTMEKRWRRLRKRAKLTNARLHDLRHSVGTFAAAAGANAFMVRDKLGHRTLAMSARYVGRDTDPQRLLADKVEARVAAALEGQTAEIMPLVPTATERRHSA